MAVTGNEAVTLSQLRTAIGGTLSETTSGADGTEAVRLSQLKLAMDNVNVVKEYSIYGWLGGSTQASAVPGSVVVVGKGNGETFGTIYIYEAENGENTNRRICSGVYVHDLSDAPKIVQEAFAAIPTTYAPPPTIPGYAWFIMPCCDVFVQLV